MKRLYLVRHAKSSWKNPGLDDFHRPLNKRGKRDAYFIGKLLFEKNIKPELIISSPAKRALDTANLLAKEIEYPSEKILEEKKLYEAGITEILAVLLNVNDEVKNLMIIAHNPGLTDFANFISVKRIDNIPTSAIAAFNIKASRWNEVNENTCESEFFEYPKKYFNKEI